VGTVCRALERNSRNTLGLNINFNPAVWLKFTSVNSLDQWTGNALRAVSQVGRQACDNLHGGHGYG
jgi:hypothetical protein